MENISLNTDDEVPNCSNFDNYVRGNVPVLTEIQQMREARRISKKNMENYQKILSEDQQLMQDRKYEKTELEKIVIELQGQLNEENYRNNEIRTQIDSMREQSNRIGEYLVQNNNMLQQCLQDKKTAADIIENNHIIIKDHCVRKMLCYNEKQKEKDKLIEEISNHRKRYKENIESQKKQCFDRLEQIKFSTKSLETIQEAIKELDQHNADCNNAIIQAGKDKQHLKIILHNKQESYTKTSQEITNQQHYFEENNEKIVSVVDENNLSIQKIETEIKVCELGLTNQKLCNSNLQENISEKEVVSNDLNADIMLLQSKVNEYIIEHENSIKELNDTYAKNTTRFEDMQLKKNEEMESIINIEKDIEKLALSNEQFNSEITTQQKLLDELQYKHDEENKEYLYYMQQFSSLEIEMNKIKQEINYQQQKTKAYLDEMNQLVNNINVEICELDAKSFQENENEEQKKAKIIEEMNLIKSAFDNATTKETEDFESAQKQLKNEIQETEKLLRNTRNSRILLQEKLKLLSEECNAKDKQLKQQESLKKVLFDGIASLNTSVTTTKPSQELMILKNKETLDEFVAPTLVRKRSFDELSSSSSVDSTLFMYRKVVEEEERRRNLLRSAKKTRTTSKK